MIQRLTVALTALIVLAMLPVITLAHDHDHGVRSVQYVANKGQWPDQVLYRSAVQGAMAFLEKDGITWVKYEEAIYERMHDAHMLPLEEQRSMAWKGHAWRMEFVGAGQQVEVHAHDRSSTYHNYFLGDDPAKWAGRVPIHGEVHYASVWPGIDIRFRGQEGHMKYDVELAPGSDPGLVAFRYVGADGLSLNKDGSLLLRTSVGPITELAPVAFYGDGAREEVACRFTLVKGELRFAFPNGYDATRPVVIDPVLIASTLSGATGSSNYGHCATYDDDGNIYSGARNFGPTYPVTLGAFQTAQGGGTDISISKYNPDGSQLLYATYLGGSSGENPHSMIVTPNRQLCMLGSTTSANFPTTPGAFNSTLAGTDITVTRFSEDGTTLIGSTLVGGSGVDGTNNMGGNYGETFRGEIYLDNAGNMLVASFTNSADFPITPGAYQPNLGGGQDGVVFAVNPSCTNLLWSTYLGGPQGDGAFGLRTGANGDVYVVGSTLSPTFPTTPGAYQTTFQGGNRDGFVVRLSPNGGQLLASTFFGTAAEDRAYFIDTDLNGDVWIYGQTAGNIPISPPGTYGTAGGTGGVFIAKLLADLSDAPVTTKIGQALNATVPVAFLVDVCDNIYISGFNSQTGLPLTADALYTVGSFYLAAFDEDMSDILFGTRYGGSHVDGGTSRFDKNGFVYQGVCSGTGSLQTTPWAHSPTQFISWDVGVFKIDFQVAGVNAAGASTLNSGCAPIVIDFQNNSTGDTWLWDFGDGSPPVEGFEPSHLYTTAGQYTVTLIAFDSLSCNLADTTYLPITIGLAQQVIASFDVQQTNCGNNEITTQNTSVGVPLSFTWLMGDGTQYSDSNVVHSYASTGTYEVTLIAYDPTWCSQPDTIVQTVVVTGGDDVIAAFELVQDPDCGTMTVSTTNTTVGPGPTYEWTFGDGGTSTAADITYTYNAPGTYVLQLLASDPASCNLLDSASAIIEVPEVVPVVAAFDLDELLDCVDLAVTTSNNSIGSSMAFLWELSDGSLYDDADISHVFTGAGTWTVTLTVSDTLGCSPSDSQSIDLFIPVPEPVVADFTLSQVADCTQLLVESQNQSTGPGIQYAWDMGDGTTYASTEVSHSYPALGSYDVQLVAFDPTGCSAPDTMVVSITVAPPLEVEAIFTLVEEPGCDQLLVVTQNNSAGVSPSYTWDMGDGTVLTGTNVTHLYQVVGTYTITLVADDPDACNLTDQVTLDVTVLPSEPVNAAFTAGQVFDCDDLLLTTGNASTGTNLLFQWDLSDGSQYNSADIEHVFSGAGTYTVTLTVSDALGCSPPSTASMEVTIDPLQPVVADFILEQVGNCNLLTVLAIDQSTGDSLAWTWDMGDGTIYTGQPPSHVYNVPGSYTVTLTLTDLGCGSDDQASQQVELIAELPVLLVGDTVICPGGSATLVASGSAGDYTWSTGESSPTITVEDGGTYTVTVTTDDCQGSASVQVIEGLEHDLGYELEACPNEALAVVVPLEGLSYQWNTGGNGRQEQVIGPGEYVFTVVDLLGCPHTDTVRVVSLDDKPQLFAPNAFSPDGDGVNDVFRIEGYGEKNMMLTIYNRWGEQLWQTNNMQMGWDGMYRGSFVKNDVYVYVLTYNGVCHAEEQRVIGHVTVLR
jgi:gliding motility-associated-like protein